LAPNTKKKQWGKSKKSMEPALAAIIRGAKEVSIRRQAP
jgi:hypothetical protein